MLENLKGINPAMAIASIITIQYFYSADISKENFADYSYLYYHGKKPTVFLRELEKFIW
jgi:hypothetical protein